MPNMSPELKKRLEAQENFGAIDREKLQQDAVELSQKAQDSVKENFIFKTLRNVFGVKDPKKFLKSVGITVASVIAVAFVGNKLSNKTADWGIKLDELLSGESVIAKGYKKISGGLKKASDSVKGFFLKSKTIDDVATAVKKENRMKPKCDMTRGYGRGFVSIFSLTPVDILGKVLDKTDDKVGLLQKLVGDEGVANDLLSKFNAKGRDNREFCEVLSNAMRKYLGGGSAVGNKEFLEALKGLQKGTFNGNDVSEFTKVAMKESGLGGLIGGWWPVNIIDSIGKKIRGDKWKGFCRGNLGDSLVKFNAVNGTLADTKLGQLAQKAITVPTESYSNFVNDKSGLGVFLCASIMSLWNNVQDAPNGQKTATAADDIVGTVGSIALATPAAFAATYSLASLSKVEGKTIFSKILKQAGKFFAMGLNDKSNKFTRFAGGALRFFLVMFAFSPMFQKPIRAVIHKIFGKPYDPNQALREKQLEEQKNQIIPELGITQGQLLEKIQNNQEAALKIQQDPELAQKIAQNPKLLIDYLDGKDISQTQAQEPKQPSQMSQVNQDLLNNKKNMTESQDLTSSLDKTPKAPEPTVQSEDKVQEHANDTATYIPSSKFVAGTSTLSDSKLQELNSALDSADKALARAQKYI